MSETAGSERQITPWARERTLAPPHPPNVETPRGGVSEAGTILRAVDGLVIPHRQDQEYSIRHVSLAVEKVQVNPEIDPGRFKLKTL